jgi:hypothetical protein
MKHSGRQKGKFSRITSTKFEHGLTVLKALSIWHRLYGFHGRLRSEKIILGSNPIDNLFSALHISGEG